eukprot:3941269-Rhodomonas_salina.1
MITHDRSRCESQHTWQSATRRTDLSESRLPQATPNTPTLRASNASHARRARTSSSKGDRLPAP